MKILSSLALSGVLFFASGVRADETQLPLTPANFGRAMSFNFANKLGMDDGDMAGDVVRVGHWNNVLGLEQQKTTVLDAVKDSTGQTVPKLRVWVVGGSSSFNIQALDQNGNADASHNDARLFNGVYDQNEGTATSIEMADIPYAHYDVIFYRSDDGDNRAGKFQVRDKILFARGGKPNPNGDGANYANAFDDSLGEGSDIAQGNVVRFSNLSGATLSASFSAVNAGDNTQRSKVVGFQIVERK